MAEGRLPAAGGHFARHQAAHTAAAVMPPAGRAAACATHDTAAALPPLLHSMGLLGLRLGGATGLGGAASRGGAAARQAAAGQRGMAQLPFKPPPGEVPKRPARKPAPAPAEGGSEASVKAPELTPEQSTLELNHGSLTAQLLHGGADGDKRIVRQCWDRVRLANVWCGSSVELRLSRCALSHSAQ